MSTKTIVEAAHWRSNSVFSTFYLKDVQLEYEDLKSLGPIVAAGDTVTG